MSLFKFHGRLITAATKQQAVRKAMAGFRHAYAASDDKYRSVSRPVREAYKLMDENYLDNGHLGKGLADEVCLVVENTEPMYRQLINPRIKAHSIAWVAFIDNINSFLEWHDDVQCARKLSSEQVKNWFRLNGLDFKSEMKPIVDEIENSRRLYEEEEKDNKATSCAHGFRRAHSCAHPFQRRRIHASSNPGGISDEALERAKSEYHGRLPKLAPGKFCKNCGCQLFKETGNVRGGYQYVCLECDENMYDAETRAR